MLLIILYDANKPLTGPVHYDIYATLVGGPILCLSSVVHAGLPGIASSIVGAVSAALSTFYFLSAGSVLLKAGERIYNETHHFNKDHNLNSISAYECMFGGLLLFTLCWLLILMLSICYKNEPTNRENERVHYYTESEDQQTRPLTGCFAGIARKLAIPFTILSFAGWAVFVYGVHTMPTAHPIPFPYDLSYWGAILSALLLYFAALLHAGCPGIASTTMGIFTSLLSMLFVVCFGQVIHQVGTDIICRGESSETGCPTPKTIPMWRIFQFSGGLAACVFWACVLMLWPFYKRSNQQYENHVTNYGNTQSVNGNNYESISLLTTQQA